MLGLTSDAVAMRRVRLRIADPDRLRLRQRLERTLATVDWTTPELPSGAVLLVRRLAPSQQRAAGETVPLGVRISAELRRLAGLARRPWLDADAAPADAVIFLDEAELAACLVRDWLRGVVAERWWWATVLGNAGTEQWLRRHVLSRGEVLVPVVSQLAARGDVVPWISRVPDGEARAAATAIARAYALPTAVPPVDVPLGTASNGPVVVADRPSAHRQDADNRHVSASARIAVLIPEAAALSLGRDQRRLVVLALAVIRAPVWARTASFATAIEVDGSPDGRLPARASHQPAITRVRSDPQPVSSDPRSTHAPDLIDGRLPHDPRPAEASASLALHALKPPAYGAARTTRVTRSDEAVWEGPPSALMTRESGQEGRQSDLASKAVLNRPSVDHGAEAPVEVTPAETGVAESAVHAPVPHVPAERILTGFGGIFYLLNAALAMGLYGDFTAPNGPNLALSPWDWLALIGRSWFGDEFIADPLWATLASLAGRGADDEPGRDIEMSDGWLDDHLVTLRSRVAAALGADDTRDVPADICRYHARVDVTASTIHVHLALSDLPLELRIAGLDRDPGWIPAAGRAVLLHFV